VEFLNEIPTDIADRFHIIYATLPQQRRRERERERWK